MNPAAEDWGSRVPLAQAVITGKIGGRKLAATMYAPWPCCQITIQNMERKIFWTAFVVLGLLADFLLPLWWALVATIPIAYISWWVAYRSDWF